MSNPRAFISFDYDNNETEKNLFAGQAKLPTSPFNIADWSSKHSLPQSQWEKLIEEKICKCNMLIVLVGKSMSTATGVVKEISFAHKNNVPVFGVYVDGANMFNYIPSGLQSGRVIKWEWPGITAAIKQVMGEGKNK